MNNSDFKEAAERYKKEMIDLYGAKKNQDEIHEPVEKENEKTKEQEQTENQPKIEEQSENQPKIEEQSENQPKIEEQEKIENQQKIEKPEKAEENSKNNIEKLTEEKIDERFPPPVIPDFIRNPQTETENDSFGYLKVSVRTGNGGIPVEDSAVIVSQTIDGKENIVRMMITDSSGDTETIKLPAPKKPSGNQPQDYEHYSTYNISAFSEGYFRESSKNAPIFEGITSIQTFFLIPMPYQYDSENKSIDYKNTEPDV